MKKLEGKAPASYWTLALIGLLAIGLAQPIFLILIWYFHVDSNKVVAANDLGALMGAIFTAGGLVVALTSIYTMASVDSVTRRAVEPLLARIPDEIDGRIKRYLEAYGYFSQAQATKGWTLDVLDDIEGLVNRAVALQPDITGLYSWTSGRFFEMAAIKWLPWFYPQYYNDGVSKTPKLEIGPFVARALDWTQSALVKGDGDPAVLYRRLAMLHGMLGDSLHVVLQYVRRSETTETIGWNNPVGIAFLLRACKTKAQAKELLDAVKCSPMDKAAIWQVIKQRRSEDLASGSTRDQYINVLVFPSENEVDPPETLGTVRILYQSDDRGLAVWTTARQAPNTILRREGIPAFTKDSTGQATSAPPIPLDNIISDLVDRFLVVANWQAGKNWLLEEM